jgi:hypothetical protein
MTTIPLSPEIYMPPTPLSPGFAGAALGVLALCRQELHQPPLANIKSTTKVWDYVTAAAVVLLLLNAFKMP